MVLQDQIWWRHIANDMAVLERELPRTITTSDPTVAEAARMIFAAGGKRLRPAFAFLCGRLNGCKGEDMLPLALALELMHTASLIHDDIIDGAQLRRGVPTVNACYGNKIAVHTGNYLVARALSLVNGYGDRRLIEALNNIVDEMVQGEFQQQLLAWNTKQHLKQYLYRTQRKTALLLAVSCETGAYAANLSDANVSLLRRYGYYLGMAFQITDDILDLTGVEETIGKPVGSDIKQGNFTLPVLYALQGPYRKELLPWLRSSKTVATHLKEIIACIQKSGGLVQSQALAERYVAKALQQLAAFTCNTSPPTLLLAK